MPNILAIETSCDETAAAIVASQGDDTLTILSSVVSSQIELHTKYGGVVPNLAAREHVRNIIPVIKETFAKAGIRKDDIDAIAVTQGPGLIPALLIGASAAKTLASVWKKPLLGIHHLEGHIYANFIGRNCRIQNAECRMQSKDETKNLQSEICNPQLFPLLALIVSGGHTQLVLMRDHFQYEIIGETRDDAAGEAFDKSARLLGLPYPGGPAIEKRARSFFNGNDQELNSKNKTNSKPQIQNSKTASDDSSFITHHASSIVLPRPMIDSDDLDFSFSGLKTAVLYLVKENESQKTDSTFINEVAHEFQEAVVDVLVAKTRKAIGIYSPKTFVIAGGVSANVRLRERMQEMIASLNLEAGLLSEKVSFLTPEFKYSLDNAAMIGTAAIFRYERLSGTERTALKANALTLEPNANLPLK